MPQTRNLELADRVVRMHNAGETFAAIAGTIHVSRQRAHRIYSRRQAELDAEFGPQDDVAERCQNCEYCQGAAV